MCHNPGDDESNVNNIASDEPVNTTADLLSALNPTTTSQDQVRIRSTIFCWPMLSNAAHFLLHLCHFEHL